MKKVCLCCSKIYFYNKYLDRKDTWEKRKFCSLSCNYKMRKGRQHKKQGKLFKCDICGETKYYSICQQIKGWKHFCSNKCLMEYRRSQKGEKALFWKGGKNKSSHGYILVYFPTHPRAMRNYVYEHILVLEIKVGRYLKKGEIPHHINGIKSDNRPENIKLVSEKEHSRIHKGWWKKDAIWFKKCSGCGRELEVGQENFYKRTNGKWFHICKKCCRR